MSNANNLSSSNNSNNNMYRTLRQYASSKNENLPSVNRSLVSSNPVLF